MNQSLLYVLYLLLVVIHSIPFIDSSIPSHTMLYVYCCVCIAPRNIDRDPFVESRPFIPPRIYIDRIVSNGLDPFD